MADSYMGISQIAADADMNSRVTACAAQQGKGAGDPGSWAYQNRWAWASSPGWGAAWDSATAADNPNPGADPAVITDAMILAQIQPMPG